MVLAHFIVSNDVERSRRFYTDVLGGKTVISSEHGDEVTYVALTNSWIIINVGGGPTDDKPTVTLEAPTDPDRVNSFLNIRVAAQAARDGASLLHPRSRRLPDRGGSNDPRQRLAPTFVTDSSPTPVRPIRPLTYKPDGQGRDFRIAFR
jgi:hypothetical protein